MIDAVQNGGYDPHKVALLITQTGGGCRASNYIHMLRKALDKAGLSFVPVLSLSFGLEKNPGFHWSVGLIRRLIYGMMYGDLIMNVANQVRPYEVHKGDTTAMVEHWLNELLDRFDKGDGMNRKKMREILDEICADFKTIPVAGEPKVRVGVVGEIYIKFSSLGNNQLEEFLLSEGAEPVVPGLTDFLIFKIYNRVSDVEMFGGSRAKWALCKFFMGYVEKCQLDMIAALKKAGFRSPGTFAELHDLIHALSQDGRKILKASALAGAAALATGAAVPAGAAAPDGAAPAAASGTPAEAENSLFSSVRVTRSLPAGAGGGAHLPGLGGLCGRYPGHERDVYFFWLQRAGDPVSFAGGGSDGVCPVCQQP